MFEAPQPISDLYKLLRELDGQPFKRYRTLLNQAFRQDWFFLRFVHIQGSPGAFPASVCQLVLKTSALGLPGGCLSNSHRRTATGDYLLRALARGIATQARQNRGAQGSGSFQAPFLPPQVLQRNLVKFHEAAVQIAFHISLPGSPDNRILGEQALCMLDQEMSGIVQTLQSSVIPSASLEEHCNVVEDMLVLQSRLTQYGLVAFVGDGSVLPRCSGVSQAPLKEGVVRFRAPEELAVEVHFPNSGRARGLGINRGVNVLIGGAFHGKSTLLNALAKGVYPHIPGDGREQVVTCPNAVFIRAEEGRAVNGLDISGFFDSLPGRVDAQNFWTRNASGSTSEAAAVIEAVLSGAKFLLIDEDTSATNFLIKDRYMRQLVPEDCVTPLFDRVRELHRWWDVSTLLVVGGSSEYLAVAHHIMAMQNYEPHSMTERVRGLALPEPQKPLKPMTVRDQRRLRGENFDPAYHATRLGKTVAARIKPLRLHERILEYGNQKLDLTALCALVDPQQVLAVGLALLLARKRFRQANLSPSELAAALSDLIHREGLEILAPADMGFPSLACPRQMEIAAAINRFKGVRMENMNP